MLNDPTSMATESMNALLVDDEPSFRRALRTSLAVSGFAIEEAHRGEEAIALPSKRPFDLVLLDINMPGIGGVETCRKMRARFPRIGIVMVTVRDAESDMVRALEAGADDYITKPVRFSRAVWRRLRVEQAGESAVLRVGELELDMNRHSLHRSSESVHLTPTEFCSRF